MINKFVVSTVAGLALIGSTLAAADCPAYLNEEEGVPCFEGKAAEVMAEMPAPQTRLVAVLKIEKGKAIFDSWVSMVQYEK